MMVVLILMFIMIVDVGIGLGDNLGVEVDFGCRT